MKYRKREGFTWEQRNLIVVYNEWVKMKLFLKLCNVILNW
jgi:hypothetical protein